MGPEHTSGGASAKAPACPGCFRGCRARYRRRACRGERERNAARAARPAGPAQLDGPPRRPRRRCRRRRARGRRRAPMVRGRPRRGNHPVHRARAAQLVGIDVLGQLRAFRPSTGASLRRLDAANPAAWLSCVQRALCRNARRKARFPSPAKPTRRAIAQPRQSAGIATGWFTALPNVRRRAAPPSIGLALRRLRPCCPSRTDRWRRHYRPRRALARAPPQSLAS